MTAVKQTFDWHLCENDWPKADTTKDDKALAEALLDRNTALTPTAVEQSALLALVTKVTNALEKLVVAPELFDAAQVDEVRAVGSFKKGTMTTKRNIADLVVVLKTLPTVEAVNALGIRVCDDIKKSPVREVVGCVPKEFGCEIAGTTAVVRLLITTIPQNVALLDKDLHLDVKYITRHIWAQRHMRWFDDNATHSTVKILIRLVKDLAARFPGFKVMNVWMIELVCHYSAMHTTTRTPLTLSQAFRRLLQLLSAGLFMSGAAGLCDPCEPGLRLHHMIPYAEQDLLCSTAQTLLRVLSHGGARNVLGLEGKAELCLEMSVWDGIVVTPLDKAFDEAEIDP